MEARRLNTGATMPAIGFGTGELVDDHAYDAVRNALQAGYRMIDTASRYNNETPIGQAVRGCGIPREDLFVTTKLWNDDQGYEETFAAFNASLTRLGLDYVDLYLLHWPSGPDRLGSWQAMEEIYRSGRTKAIGVSNFTPKHLRELMAHANITPAVNQIEFHPSIYSEQKPIVDFCEQQGIVVQGYCPLMHGHMDSPVVREVCQRTGRPAAQVLLRWSVQHGVVPLPRSDNPEHIASNIAIDGFELKPQDMSMLDQLNNGYRVFPNPFAIS